MIEARQSVNPRMVASRMQEAAPHIYFCMLPYMSHRNEAVSTSRGPDSTSYDNGAFS